MNRLAISPSSHLFRFVFYLTLAGLIAYSAFSIYASTRQMYWDFPNYYVSSRLILDGESVSQFYDNEWFESQASAIGIENPARFNPFPPVTSLIMLPLSGFEPLTAKRIWVLINVMLLVFVIWLSSKLFRFNMALSTFIILLSGTSLALNFRLGQFYLLILLLLLVVYFAYQKGYLRSSALLLSAITIIKYFPLVFIAGFLKRKYLFTFSFGIVLLILLQWLIFGTTTMQAYIQVLQNHLGGSIKGQGQHIISFQSYNSLFSNLFLPNPETSVPPLIDSAIGKSLAQIIVLLLIGGSALYTANKVRRKSNAEDFTLIIVGMAALSLLPASASYHFVLLLFPFLLLMKHQLEKGNSKQNLLLIFLFTLVNNVLLLPIPDLGVKGLDMLLDYPRLWSMTLLYFYSLRLLLQLPDTFSGSKAVKYSYLDVLIPLQDRPSQESGHNVKVYCSNQKAYHSI